METAEEIRNVYCGDELVGTVHEWNHDKGYLVVDVSTTHVAPIIIIIPVTTVREVRKKGIDIRVYLAISKDALLSNYEFQAHPDQKRMKS